MALKFKESFDGLYVRMLADKLATVSPEFVPGAFVAALDGALAAQEFLARMDILAGALDRHVPGDYAARLAIFHQILGDELATEAGMFTQGWWLWPIARYVERHATENFAASVAFIESLTRRHTGEFAVRPLLVAFPDAMLDVMTGWSRSDNVHVRRLSSEGVRIRLPWAKKLTVALDHFPVYKALLTHLKDDPSRFVQKSVGNNLNDLFKDAPEKAREIIAGWEAEPLSPAARWVVRHGMRNQRS
jgi:3-methyladenine DNA glycosylase AlkC